MITYFLIYIAFLLFIGLIGFGGFFLLRNKIKLDFFQLLLSSIFIGYIISITSFSIIATGFLTVNVFYLVLLLFSLKEILREPYNAESTFVEINYKFILIIFGSALFFFGIAFYSVSNPKGFIPFYYNSEDYILYAKIAKYLSETGQENGFNHLNILDSYYNGIEPYHFFDLWGASLLNEFSGISHYLGLRLIIYPMFYFLFFIGTICLFKRKTYLNLLIAFLIIWLGGFFISIIEYNSCFRFLSELSLNLFSPGRYKLSYFYVFILISFLLFQNKQYIFALLCFLGLSIANIISAPTILITLFLINIVSLKLKFVSKKFFLKIFFYLIIFSVLFLLFFTIFKGERSGLAGAEITTPLKLIRESISIQDLRTQRNIIVSSLIYLLFLYFPFIFLIRIYRSRSINILLIIVLLLIVISLATWALLFYELNSSQIFTNFSIPALNVFAIILVVYGINNEMLSFKKNSKLSISLILLLFIIIGVNIINTYSQISKQKIQLHTNNYLREVCNSIKEGELVASYKSSKDMSGMHSKYNAVYPLGSYLFLFNKNVNSVNISDLDTPIDTTSNMNINRSYKAIRDGLFFRFSKMAKNENLNKDELIMKFIKDYNIKFIISSKKAILPQVLNKNIKKMIIDPLSGEKFIELE